MEERRHSRVSDLMLLLMLLGGTNIACALAGHGLGEERGWRARQPSFPIPMQRLATFASTTARAHSPKEFGILVVRMVVTEGVVVASSLVTWEDDGRLVNRVGARLRARAWA